MAKRDHEESMTPAELNDAAYWAGLWSRIEHWMFLGVVLTLALEFIALKFAEPYKEKLEKHREFEMSRLSKEAESARADIAKANAETAKANEAAATANERAAQAQLELQKLQNPRMIDLEKFKAALAGKPKGKVSILYVEHCTDCEWFAWWIASFLRAADWGIEHAPTVITGVPAGQNPAMAQGGQPWGVSLVANTQAEGSIESVLRQAFLATMGRVGGGTDKELPDGLIRVIVAPRP
jgi:hypothetical protein